MNLDWMKEPAMGGQRRVRGASRELVESARELRHRQTPAEARFWDAVRDRSAYSFRIRRQHPIGRYVLDFWIPSHRLAIELDGDVHLDDEIAAQDAVRTEWLESQGVQVLRFTNAEIFNDLERVFQIIDRHIREINAANS
jgi:very-short-patch-repair endonuclease